jgi:hypothetical protein
LAESAAKERPNCLRFCLNVSGLMR